MVAHLWDPRAVSFAIVKTSLQQLAEATRDLHAWGMIAENRFSSAAGAFERWIRYGLSFNGNV